MMARLGYWYETQPGSYVRDPQGNSWRVDRAGRGYRLLTDRLGSTMQVTPRPNDVVTILEPTEAEAVETVRRLLGGVPE